MTWISSFVNGGPCWMLPNQANWKLASGDMTESTVGSSYVSFHSSTLGSVLIWILALVLFLGVVLPVRAELKDDPIPSNFQHLQFVAKLSSMEWCALKYIPVSPPAIEKEPHLPFIQPNNSLARNTQKGRVSFRLCGQIHGVIFSGAIRRGEITKIIVARQSLIPILPPIINTHYEVQGRGVSGVFYGETEPESNRSSSVICDPKRLKIQHRKGNVSPLTSLHVFPTDSIRFIHLSDPAFCRFSTLLHSNNAIFRGFDVLPKQSRLRSYLPEGEYAYPNATQT